MMKQQDPTFSQCQQTIGQVKRRLAQTQGEASQIISDTQSQSLDSIMQMLQQVFSNLQIKENEIAKLKETIQKCYSEHPTLKSIIETSEKKSPKKE